MNAHDPIIPYDPLFWSECEQHHFLDETENDFRRHSEIKIISPRAGRWVAEIEYHGQIMSDIATDSIYSIADDLAALYDRGLNQFRITQSNKANKT